MTFYSCSHCGNILALLTEGGPTPSCCGQKVSALEPNTVDAAQEKHVPKVTKNGNEISVQVGDVAHPMEAAHNIMFIYVQTKSGGQRKALKVGGAPSAKFLLDDDEAVAVYAYCNLHGLWKTSV